MSDLLDSTITNFPGSRDSVESKKQNILPKNCLRVGKDSEFTTIGEAIRHALPGTEILVDPGIYREFLIITKPVTLRCRNINDSDVLQSLEGNGSKSKWAEIHATGMDAICCILKPSQKTHIIGFKIFCEAPIINSFHALSVKGGLIVCRNSMLESSSGPVVCAELQGSNVIMQACVVHNGAQGGILAVDGAHLSLHQVHCCRNAAVGLELRSKGSVSIESCHKESRLGNQLGHSLPSIVKFIHISRKVVSLYPNLQHI